MILQEGQQTNHGKHPSSLENEVLPSRDGKINAEECRPIRSPKPVQSADLRKGIEGRVVSALQAGSNSLKVQHRGGGLWPTT